MNSISELPQEELSLIGRLAEDFAASFATTREDGSRLRDFIHFLDHRHQDPGLVSYGLLVQSNRREDLEDFAAVLEQILAQAESLKDYQLYSISESNVSKVDWKPYSDSHIILVLKDCSTSGSVRPILSAFAETPAVVKIVFAPPRIVNDRFSRSQEFMRDVVPRKVLLRELGTAEVKNRARQMFLREYAPSREFLEDLGYYIDAEYPRRDLSCHEFLQDLWTQVAWKIQETAGIAAYRSGRELEASLLPDSEYAAERKRRALARAEKEAKSGAAAFAESAAVKTAAESAAAETAESTAVETAGSTAAETAENTAVETAESTAAEAAAESAAALRQLEGHVQNLLAHLHALDAGIISGETGPILTALRNLRLALASFPAIWENISLRDLWPFYEGSHPGQSENDFLTALGCDPALVSMEEKLPALLGTDFPGRCQQAFGEKEWTDTAIAFVKKHFRISDPDSSEGTDPSDAVLSLGEALEQELREASAQDVG